MTHILAERNIKVYTLARREAKAEGMLNVCEIIMKN